MRFRYAFQKIVDLKSSEKQQAEWILSNAVGKLTSEESELSGLNKEKLELQQQTLLASSNSTTVSDLMLTQYYLDHLDRQIVMKREDVLVARKDVTIQQSHLAEKMLQEKLWNKAKEKDYKKFSETARKKEQDELDEIATMRFKQTT